MGDAVHRYLFDLFQSDLVVNALVAGTVIAAVCGIIGFFVVLRGLSFIGHAVTDIGFTGAAGAGLLGLDALWGLLAFSVGSALTVGAIGGRERERDLVTGLILAVALGLGALFLYLNTGYSSRPFALLFGSIFVLDPGLIHVMLAISAGCLLALAMLYRPLLFASASPEVAAAKGVRVRLVSALFLVCMAVAVSEAAQLVGVLLSTALLIGPAATAVYLTARPLRALALAATIGILDTWLGIILSYDSYYWPPGNHGWPVSFFITTLTLAGYLAARFLWAPRRRRQAGAEP